MHKAILLLLVVFCVEAMVQSEDKMFWNGGSTIKDESLIFIQKTPGQPATADLLFVPEKITSIVSTINGTIYAEGKDYIWKPGSNRLELTPDSHIGYLQSSNLFKPQNAPESLPAKIDDPQTNLLFYRTDGFLKLQVAVSYSFADKWRGITPPCAVKLLPRTVEKLKSGKLNIALTGDSISVGWNSSATVKVKPFLPSYPDQFRKGLENIYKANVKLDNYAVAGRTAGWGLINTTDKVIGSKPDLVIIAYGMNDLSAYKDAGMFQSKITDIMNKCRNALPNVEFLIISPALGNPEWCNTPWELTFKYREKLLALQGPGVAVAALPALWADILKQKDYYSMTGNGVNHPNDFGHMLYASFMLQMFVE